MKLSAEEENLINRVREIDRRNPLGIDGYTENAYIDICLKLLISTPEEAGRRYKLFVEESKKQAFIDIKEAQREKARYEDLRQTPAQKREYEESYNTHQWAGLKPPIWKKNPAADPERISPPRIS